jgi:hypothetical protein
MAKPRWRGVRADIGPATGGDRPGASPGLAERASITANRRRVGGGAAQALAAQ